MARTTNSSTNSTTSNLAAATRTSLTGEAAPPKPPPVPLLPPCPPYAFTWEAYAERARGEAHAHPGGPLMALQAHLRHASQRLQRQKQEEEAESASSPQVPGAGAAAGMQQRMSNATATPTPTAAEAVMAAESKAQFECRTGGERTAAQLAAFSRLLLSAAPCAASAPFVVATASLGAQDVLPPAPPTALPNDTCFIAFLDAPSAQLSRCPGFEDPLDDSGSDGVSSSAKRNSGEAVLQSVCGWLRRLAWWLLAVGRSFAAGSSWGGAAAAIEEGNGRQAVAVGGADDARAKAAPPGFGGKCAGWHVVHVSNEAAASYLDMQEQPTSGAGASTGAAGLQGGKQQQQRDQQRRQQRRDRQQRPPLLDADPRLASRLFKHLLPFLLPPSVAYSAWLDTKYQWLVRDTYSASIQVGC